ncbi:hypothetical protein IKQ26_05215 [bacterium]|nr:hypothetical protein [bacterium]
MQVIEASKLFKDKSGLDNLVLNSENDLSLDFSQIDKISLKDISTILNLKKIAVLNRKNLRLDNVTSNVMQVLEVTGLYKTIDGKTTFPL